jgi:hypothetical protein
MSTDRRTWTVTDIREEWSRRAAELAARLAVRRSPAGEPWLTREEVEYLLAELHQRDSD